MLTVSSSRSKRAMPAKLRLWLYRSEHGAVMTESAIVIPFWILLLMLLTEVGFAISTWHSLSQAAGEAVNVGVSLPLPNNLVITNVPLNTARNTCNTNVTNRVLTKAEGRNHLVCLTGLIVKAHLRAKDAFVSGDPTMSVNLVGGVNQPGSMLSISVQARHKTVFGIWPRLNLSGSNTARYVFPAY